jgi:hypothetical protein
LTKLIRIWIFACGVLAYGSVAAQTISTAENKPLNTDSLLQKAPLSTDKTIDSLLRYHTPKKAAMRSLILPGLGQIYNGKYWKLPLVYAAIGVPTAILAYNLTWYKRTRFAYTALSTNDRAAIQEIHPKLQGYVQFNNTAGLQVLRNQFRRDVDYSILFVAVAWALNVIDASVDAHLKSFDVSPDLSLQMKAGYSEMASTNGVSLVLTIR